MMGVVGSLFGEALFLVLFLGWIQVLSLWVPGPLPRPLQHRWWAP